ncbi:MAG: tripartite tricarboxylate transporter substrate binding protein [Betaproteobacteria bacterium]|nr:tripartite tricarboxylate transporter substrate binding protein [Betaproteobacteria bacterium]
MVNATIRRLAAAWLPVMVFLCAAPAAGQGYPVRPVRLIVPFPPGGGTDTMARIIAPKLSESLGQQVVPENRGGAGANIGAELAAKSPPDGYTLMVATITNAIGASLYTKLNYDLVRDFATVTQLATTPHILVVHPSVPVKSVKEFIALAKARPGDLAYSSSGAGSAAHLAGELFNSLTGTRTTHVPYRGGGPSMIALVGGEVSLCFATMPSAIGFVRSGKLRGIAVTTAKRSPSAPQLPTIAETGVAGYEAGSWYGLSVPAGTSKDIVGRLHGETIKVLGLPDVKERLFAAGFEIVTSTPEQFAAFTRNEIQKWGKLVKAASLRVD